MHSWCGFRYFQEVNTPCYSKPHSSSSVQNSTFSDTQEAWLECTGVLCYFLYEKYAIGCFDSQPDHFSDAFVFNVERKVKWHNVRTWGSENFHETLEVSNESEVTVWWVISLIGVIGLYHFDELSVNGDSCSPLWNIYFLPMLQDLPQNLIFLRYRAPSHYTQAGRFILCRRASSWNGRVV